MSDRRVLTPPSAPHGRRAVVGLIALTAILPVVTSCGAGLDAQTTQVKSTIDGSNADLGSLAIRNMRVDTPPIKGFVEPDSSADIFLSIVNGGSNVDQLISASSPAAAEIAIPRTDAPRAEPEVGGTLLLPPNRTTTHGPSTTHLRMDGVRGKLYAGQFVSVTMRFQVAGVVTVNVPFVKDPLGG